jgi:hypothetical protein
MIYTSPVVLFSVILFLDQVSLQSDPPSKKKKIHDSQISFICPAKIELSL